LKGAEPTHPEVLMSDTPRHQRTPSPTKRRRIAAAAAGIAALAAFSLAAPSSAQAATTDASVTVRAGFLPSLGGGLEQLLGKSWL
jgi:hypothetical protein